MYSLYLSRTTLTFLQRGAHCTLGNSHKIPRYGTAVASDNHKMQDHCLLEDIQDEGRLAGVAHPVADLLQHQHHPTPHCPLPSQTCSRHRSSGEDHLSPRNLVLILAVGPVLGYPELQAYRDLSIPIHPSMHKACTAYPARSHYEGTNFDKLG